MTTPDVYRDAEYIADVSGIIPYDNDSHHATNQTPDITARLKKVQTSAKVAFIDRLLRDLDILIYCELSALYYMDCSITLFSLRAIIQLIFFTPKSPPFEPTRNQPFITAILGSNIFCMLFHHFCTRPEASEATRGYLHGGILIDFIGQKAPIPLARLLFLDFLVLGLDLIMLGLIVERRTELLGGSEEAAGRDAHPMDMFVSGQAVVMDVGLVDLVRDQWRYSPAAARRSTPYVPSDQTAAFLRERFGIRVGPDGRMERIATES
ncbi:DUF1746-domain-containing protein [Aspergillus sclerotioniger CBS 115572]|uniref:DUF1746-domain-containing protein n=1 Tax=Aspergillus sclerotioniger CBS 115572 TaxID=1450535 RepID=A0A317VBB6_9EURO|nr:DUF1746-domain-containing protein [Aspergillus sclerotioniger CBS 115572]PWY70367.1 DUF1746-domain-containing protein [Aspergillus sclerotioniger CBS 115572]